MSNSNRCRAQVPVPFTAAYLPADQALAQVFFRKTRLMRCIGSFNLCVEGIDTVDEIPGAAQNWLRHWERETC